MVQKVPIPLLFNVAAPGNKVQRNTSAGKLVQRSRLARRQSWGHEAGSVGDKVTQPGSMSCGVSRHLKAVRRTGGIAGEHHIKPAFLVDSGELQDVIAVNAGGNFRPRVDAAAKDAEGRPGSSGRFPGYAYHPHNADGIRCFKHIRSWPRLAGYYHVTGAHCNTGGVKRPWPERCIQLRQGKQATGRAANRY